MPHSQPRDVEPQLGLSRVRLLDDLFDDVDLGVLGQPSAGQSPVLMDQMLAGGLDGGHRAVLGRRQLDQLTGATPRLRGDVEMIPQQEQERLGPDERSCAPDGVSVTFRLRLDGEVQTLLQVERGVGPVPRPNRSPWPIGHWRCSCGNGRGRPPHHPDAQTTQISSIPLAIASSAMIWSTGLVSPSRSTRGSMAFCTGSEAGNCRAPRPAAVITALEMCNATSSLPPVRRRCDLHPAKAHGLSPGFDLFLTRSKINLRRCQAATPTIDRPGPFHSHFGVDRTSSDFSGWHTQFCHPMHR